MRAGFALQRVTVRWLGTFLEDPLDVPGGLLCPAHAPDQPAPCSFAAGDSFLTGHRGSGDALVTTTAHRC